VYRKLAQMNSLQYKSNHEVKKTQANSCKFSTEFTTILLQI